jgi:hypothetical protein
LRRYAEDTSVSTDKSIGEIRSTLRRYGATNMMHVEGETQAAIVFDMKDRRVMFRVAMPDLKNKEFQLTPTGRWSRTEKQAFDAWEQACRARWRSLALVIKAKLEAVGYHRVRNRVHGQHPHACPTTGPSPSTFVRGSRKPTPPEKCGRSWHRPGCGLLDDECECIRVERRIPRLLRTAIRDDNIRGRAWTKTISQRIRPKTSTLPFSGWSGSRGACLEESVRALKEGLS